MTEHRDATSPNEIVAAVDEVRSRSAAARRGATDKLRTWPLARIGLGVGIGSAAIAGAVLYASRQKREEKDR